MDTCHGHITGVLLQHLGDPRHGHQRHKTQEVVQLIELNWRESTPPNTWIPRYVLWKYNFLIHVIYPAWCNRRVTIFSSSPHKNRSATCGTRNIHVLLAKTNLDPPIDNEKDNILPPLLLSTISFKSLRFFQFLKTLYRDDHIRIVFPTHV